MEKKCVVIDDCMSKKANCFTTICESREEALTEAESQFNRLTGYDKKQRDGFYVGLFEIDEDGEPGECIEIVKEYI